MPEHYLPVALPASESYSTWAAAVADFLYLGNARQPALATGLGVPTSTVNRYLNGKRRPSADMILKMNEALEELLSCPAASAYLNSIAFYCGLLGDQTSKEMFRSGLPQRVLMGPFADLVGYFKPDVWPAYLNANLRVTRVLKTWKLRIEGVLRGEVPERLWFDTLSEVCRLEGFDISPWLLSEEVLAVNRQLDLLVLDIRRQAATFLTHDAAARAELEFAMIATIREYQVALGIKPNIINSAEVNAVTRLHGPITDGPFPEYQLLRQIPGSVVQRFKNGAIEK